MRKSYYAGAFFILEWSIYKEIAISVMPGYRIEQEGLLYSSFCLRRFLVSFSLYVREKPFQK